MNTTNPYAQGGWQNWAPTAPVPPTFGALPHPGTVSSPDWISLAYETADGDVLDCTLLSPNKKLVCEVSTEILDNARTTTMFSHGDGRPFAKIEWNEDGSNFVEIQGILPRHGVLQWIRYSREEMRRDTNDIFIPASSATRVIRVGGQDYTFERHRGTIYMYQHNDQSQKIEFLAKFHRCDDSPVLDVAPKAIRCDLLKPLIVALVLLTEHHGIRDVRI